MHSGFTLNRFSMLTAERPTLEQFVLLSLMLHVLVIVLFGDTAGGGARRGEKLWGALTVTVQNLLPERRVELKTDRGGVLPQRPAPDTRIAPASPGKAAPGTVAPASAATEAAPPAEDAAPPAQAPSFELPPLMSTDVEKPVTDFVVPKPSVDRAFVPLAPAPPALQAPRETAAIPPPAIVVPEPAPPKIERAPIAPVQPIAPLEPLPREQPVAAPALAPLPPKIEREIAKPVVTATEPAAREVVPPVVQPTAPVAATASPKPERENAQPVAPPAEVKPREIPAAPPPTALSEPLPRADAATSAKPQRDVTTPAAPAGPPAGTPSATRDLFKPRGDGGATAPSGSASPPSPAAGKAPGIDLDAVRQRARELSSGGGPRTVLPFPMTPPPKPKTTVQQAFDKALKKNDCRDAHEQLGLAAVVPLVIDAFRENGCKW